MQQPLLRNVFVLCTGRCGSTTFARACGHMTNWSAGHETRSHLWGADRLAYPAGHIEADNRLSWMLGRLERAFGPDAAYVHLTRDPEAVAQSYAQRHDFGIMQAYQHGIIFPEPGHRRDSRPVIGHARDMVETINANIDAFLHGKPHVMRMRLEQAETDFPRFWDWLRAEGRLDSAMQEWSIRHNETAPVARSGIGGRVFPWQRRKLGASRSSPVRRGA